MSKAPKTSSRKAPECFKIAQNLSVFTQMFKSSKKYHRISTHVSKVPPKSPKKLPNSGEISIWRQLCLVPPSHWSWCPGLPLLTCYSLCRVALGCRPDWFISVSNVIVSSTEVLKTSLDGGVAILSLDDYSSSLPPSWCF